MLISFRGIFTSFWDLTEVSEQSWYKVLTYELVNPTFKISLIDWVARKRPAESNGTPAMDLRFEDMTKRKFRNKRGINILPQTTYWNRTYFVTCTCVCCFACVCVLLCFLDPIVGKSRFRCHSLNQGTWGCRNPHPCVCCFVLLTRYWGNRGPGVIP